MHDRQNFKKLKTLAKVCFSSLGALKFFSHKIVLSHFLGGKLYVGSKTVEYKVRSPGPISEITLFKGRKYINRGRMKPSFHAETCYITEETKT